MIDRPSEAFPNVRRLRKRREFLQAQRTGRRWASSHFVVYLKPNGGRPARLGITVSRKVGKANMRNLLKRRVREVFRRGLAKFPAGVDVVVVAKSGVSVPGFSEIRDELSLAARRADRSTGETGGRP